MEKQQFYIGQTFEGIYPPEAAAWCNANNAHIEETGTTVITVTDKIPATEEIEKVITETVIDPETGEETEIEKTVTEYVEVIKESEPYEKEVKVYTIVANSIPMPTKAELTAFVSAEADKVAYGGITIIANGQEYLFKTTTDNITRCNSVLAMFEVLPEDTVIPWEVWQGDVPTMLPVNKVQFKQCFAFGSQMIIGVETVKGTLNAEVQNLTDEQLADADYVNAFKENAVIQLTAVNTVFSIDPVEPETEEA